MGVVGQLTAFLIAMVMGIGAGEASAQVTTPQTKTHTQRLAGLARAIEHHRKFDTCFRTKIRTGFCSYGANDARRISPPQAEELAWRAAQRLARLDGGQSAGLVYHAREDGALETFLISENGLVAHGEVAADVDVMLEGFRQRLGINARAATRSAVPLNAPALQPAPQIDLDALSQVLLPPEIMRAIDDHDFRRLLVLPSGAVGQAPFPALPLSDGAVLVDRAAIVLLPGLDALFTPEGALPNAYDFNLRDALDGPKTFVGNPAYGKVAGWTLPTLPGAEREARAVAAMFGETNILTGQQASKTAVLDALHRHGRDGGIIYLATHGVSDPVNPMDGSFLAVAGDVIPGATIRDLKMLDKHPLIVMSACQTGLGKTFGGGGFGLSRAWYTAGAGQVVGSLWNVDDEGTDMLMQAFARLLKEGSYPTETALQGAMQLVRQQYSQDPAIWASFVVFGNPAI